MEDSQNNYPELFDVKRKEIKTEEDYDRLQEELDAGISLIAEQIDYDHIGAATLGITMMLGDIVNSIQVEDDYDNLNRLIDNFLAYSFSGERSASSSIELRKVIPKSDHQAEVFDNAHVSDHTFDSVEQIEESPVYKRRLKRARDLKRPLLFTAFKSAPNKFDESGILTLRTVMYDLFEPINFGVMSNVIKWANDPIGGDILFVGMNPKQKQLIEGQVSYDTVDGVKVEGELGFEGFAAHKKTGKIRETRFTEVGLVLRKSFYEDQESGELRYNINIETAYPYIGSEIKDEL